MLTSEQARVRFSPVIVDLPEGFSIPTNAGLHGNMQFFEVSDDHSLTVCTPFIDDETKDTIDYVYSGHDSNEGTVRISYRTICGSDADSPDAEGWDVDVTCGSDVWGLEESGTAVQGAIKLHKALGRDKPYKE